MILKLRSLLWTLPFAGFFLGYLIPLYVLSRTTQKTPHLVGKLLQEALTMLSEQQLNARITQELEDAIIPAGTIMHQIPSPGQPVKSNQSIALTVSKKPALPATPDLISKNIKELNACTKKINALVELIGIPSGGNYPGCLAQTPSSDTPLQKKTIIAYIPKQQEKLVVIPNLVGSELATATECVNKIPLTLQIFYHGILVQEPVLYSTASIIAQRPLAGSIINLTKPPCIQLEIA